jgi:hypothetical protein
MSISHPRLRRTPPQITNPGIHAAAPVAKVITNDFGDNEKRYCEQRSRDTPQPAPEHDADEDHHRVEGETATQQQRRHQPRFDEVQRVTSRGSSRGLPKR